jgi:hypothetical protein
MSLVIADYVSSMFIKKQSLILFFIIGFSVVENESFGDRYRCVLWLSETFSCCSHICVQGAVNEISVFHDPIPLFVMSLGQKRICVDEKQREYLTTSLSFAGIDLFNETALLDIFRWRDHLTDKGILRDILE